MSTGHACEVHGPAPDPLTRPGAAIEWQELHYPSLAFDTRDREGRAFVVSPETTVCRPKAKR